MTELEKQTFDKVNELIEKNKQIEEIRNDLIEIFDEEYSRRNLLTPQNTAEKLVAKGYFKASEVASEIFEEVEEKGKVDEPIVEYYIISYSELAELKKKYTEEGK